MKQRLALVPVARPKGVAGAGSEFVMPWLTRF
jgi:hypothetical protein